MEQEEKDIELIDAYHKGKLSTHEIEEFDKRRADDAEFNKQVEDYLHVMSEVRSFGEQEFMKKLGTWEEEISGRKSAKVIPIKRILSVAAVILVLMIPIGYLVLQNVAQPNNEELFATYFQPYEDIISQRSDAQSLQEKGLSAYNQQNYRAAIAYFESHIDENLQDNAIKTYLGISYLAVSEAEQAEKWLKETSKNATGLYREVSEWYLALTYLKLGESKKAQEQLTLITQHPDHMFKSQAEVLYRELGN
ncbi:hypothetical protein JMN32_10950 [Fulvivirga sp. 29W222]|uniref:Tetratricopeptide repeat protein n=1 Tax=Fulvivirga marina TaxID=2494733 RepID=A0A937FXZ4_9BACT|nr:hypothetical protein [Fulvivirga marina]MBL6446832.1 hypothetical protein [Fulvivirga marina]